VRIISVVDNTSGTSFNYSKIVKRLDRPNRHFLSEHGLSILVETDEGKKILVDTGASPMVFEHNLSLLGFKPSDIDAVFISHGHYDHLGGLVSMIDAGVPIYGDPKIFSLKRFAVAVDGTKRDISAPKELIEALPRAKLNLSSASVEIVPGVKTSGQIVRESKFEVPDRFLKEEAEGNQVNDDVLEEQALFIQTKKGLVILSGCGHPGIVNVVTQAKRSFDKRIYMVIGGFHLSSANQDRIRKTMDGLKALGVDRIAPTHCTGFEALKMMSDRFVGFDMLPSGSEINI
jgi:7,8-dihydropterin-6-yl-methyl-4-(beta-D-ribofuranosyl)aminobenzene 5'-phosphate synthase